MGISSLIGRLLVGCAAGVGLYIVFIVALASVGVR